MHRCSEEANAAICDSVICAVKIAHVGRECLYFVMMPKKWSGQNWTSKTGSYTYVGYCYWNEHSTVGHPMVIAQVMLWNLQDGVIQFWLLFFKVVATSEWVWGMSAHWCSYRTWAHQKGDHCNVISQGPFRKMCVCVCGGGGGVASVMRKALPSVECEVERCSQC